MQPQLGRMVLLPCNSRAGQPLGQLAPTCPLLCPPCLQPTPPIEERITPDVDEPPAKRMRQASPDSWSDTE